MNARTETERKVVAWKGLSAAGQLAAFLLGGGTIHSEDALDEKFEQVIDLLDEARNERWRLRTD